MKFLVFYLQILSAIFPGSFCNPAIFEELLNFLRVDEEVPVDTTILIFTNIGHMLEVQSPQICRYVLLFIIISL